MKHSLMMMVMMTMCCSLSAGWEQMAIAGRAVQNASNGGHLGFVTCPACNGKRGGLNWYGNWCPCNNCNGSGKVFHCDFIGSLILIGAGVLAYSIFKAKK